MDPAAAKGRENVDTNDSNPNGTLLHHKAEVVSEVKWQDASSDSVGSSSTSGSSSSRGGSGVPVPPDGGWGWVVVFAAFMINFIADGVSFSFGFLFIEFVYYFGASKAKTSWVGSIFFSMPLLAGPVASYLIDRYGCRRMCILGALLSTASFLVSVFADSLEVLFLTFTAAGLGLALCYVTSIVIVAYYFEKRRSLATGLAAVGTGAGTFLVPPLSTVLLEHYAWQGTLVILAGFFLNMVVFGALMRDLEEPDPLPEDKEEGHRGDLPDHLENSERLCSSMVQLPTYLGDNMSPEIISELSSKEGTHLSSLLEQHPYLLDSIIKKDPDGSVDSSTHPKGERRLRKRGSHRAKATPSGDSKATSIAGKLDSAYLRNLKFQRGSITYRGAMLNIHRYRLKASSCPDIYRNSMVTISEEKSCLFLHDLKELMLEMFDFSNFKNVGYTLFCISNFLLYACVDIPYVYIPDYVCTSGADTDSASMLISVLGVLNCLGVVIVGYIGDKPWLDPSILYSGFILLSGLSLVLLPLVINYYATAVLVGIYGFTISANYTLVPVIIVNLISLDDFTGAYGLLLLVQGVASLLGPPAAGALFDMTGSYDITFYCTGLIIIASGALVIPVSKSAFCRKGPAPSSKATPIAESRTVKCPPPDDFMSNDETALKNAKNKMIKQREAGVEHTLPLLQNKLSISVGDNNNPHALSIYTNPLSSV